MEKAVCLPIADARHALTRCLRRVCTLPEPLMEKKGLPWQGAVGAQSAPPEQGRGGLPPGPPGTGLGAMAVRHENTMGLPTAFKGHSE